MKTISTKASKKSGRATKTAANASGGNRPDAAKAKLETLATEIQSGHRRCVEALRGVVTQAAAIGTSLNEAKKLVGHGGWKAWVEEHCRFTLRMAQNYMLVARHHDRIVARFGTGDAQTLTDFITAAHELEHTRREKTQALAPKGTKPDPFRLPEVEVVQRQQRFRDEVRGAGAERVAKEQAVATFVREKVNALYAAVRRFVASKESAGLAGEGLDAADLGMLLIDSLKAALDPAGLLVAEPIAKLVPVEPTPVVPPEPVAGETPKHLTNGAARTALVI